MVKLAGLKPTGRDLHRTGILTIHVSVVTRIWKLKDVVRYLHIHPMTVYKLARAGKIPAAKVGNQWRFRKDFIDEWMRENSFDNLRRGAAKKGR